MKEIWLSRRKAERKMFCKDEMWQKENQLFKYGLRRCVRGLSEKSILPYFRFCRSFVNFSVTNYFTFCSLCHSWGKRATLQEAWPRLDIVLDFWIVFFCCSPFQISKSKLNLKVSASVMLLDSGCHALNPSLFWSKILKHQTGTMK